MTKKIACLGWGSLVWDPRSLPTTGCWHEDGPGVKVEFLRQSNDDRITLVLDEDADFVPSLWSMMTCSTVKGAVEALHEREGRPGTRKIGIWERQRESFKDSNYICKFMEFVDHNKLDAVVWTKLGPKFNNVDGYRPTEKEVIDHFIKLEGCKRFNAEEYIRKAHPQINTKYRRKIKEAMGWKPCG